MTQIEQIKAEIERLKTFFKTEREKTTTTNKGMLDKLSFSSKIVVLEELIVFINSLHAEQPGEELEYLATSLEETIGTSPHSRETIISYLQQAAQWQKEQTINKASQWLNENVVEYHPRKGKLKPVVNINAFREAMEKEDEQLKSKTNYAERD